MANDIKNVSEQQSLQERLLEKSTKTIEKQVAEATERKLQAGQDPQKILSDLLKSLNPQQNQSQDILAQLQQLSEEQIPSGERMGLIPSLLSGEGFSRPEKTEDLGLTNAVKVMQLQQGQQEAQRKIPQQQTDLLNSLIDLSVKAARFQTEGEQIERDVAGQLTTKGIAQTKETGVTATKQAEDIIKKAQLKKDLDVYFEIADILNISYEEVRSISEENEVRK